MLDRPESNGSARARTKEEPRPALPLGFQLDGDMQVTAPNELVEDTLPREGTAILGGQSGTAKTFIAVHLAIACGSGGSFCGRVVNEIVGTAVIAYEGGGLIQNRIIGGKQHAGITKPLPITHSSMYGNLMDDAELKRLIRDMKTVDLFFQYRFNVPLGLIIIDTASQAFAMAQENDNAEIARVCGRLRRIHTETSALAMAVHHYGKDQNAGLRGGSAWRANNDAVIACLGLRNATTGARTNRSLVVEKNREGPEGSIGGFDLGVIEIGTAPNGRPITTCVIEFTGAVRESATETPAQRKFRDAFNECLHTHPRPHRPFESLDVVSPEVTAVPVTAVKDEFYRRYVEGAEDPAARRDAARMSFKRALSQLSANGRYGVEVVNGEELVWRT